MLTPRLVDDARRAVALAHREAQALGHSYIGAEHLLLGLSAAYGSPAARALVSLGVTPASVCMEIVTAIGQGGMHSADQTGFAPHAKRALQLSVREALSFRSTRIGSEHLLLGLLRDGDSSARYVLAQLDAAPRDVARQLYTTMRWDESRFDRDSNRYAASGASALVAYSPRASGRSQRILRRLSGRS